MYLFIITMAAIDAEGKLQSALGYGTFANHEMAQQAANERCLEQYPKETHTQHRKGIMEIPMPEVIETAKAFMTLAKKKPEIVPLCSQNPEDLAPRNEECPVVHRGLGDSV